MPPTAPASAASRPSTRSRWSASPTSWPPTSRACIDLDGVQGRAAGDDRPLRAHGRPRAQSSIRRPGSTRSRSASGAWTRPATTRSTPPCTGRGSRCWTRPRGQHIVVPPSGHMAGIWGRNDDTRGVHKAPANEVVRGATRSRAADHQGRARPAEPARDQLHPRVPRPRHPRVGRAHAVERSGVALPQRPAPLQLPRGVDPRRHAVGGVRAERPRPVGARSAARSPPSS